jgi:hypothetical protein
MKLCFKLALAALLLTACDVQSAIEQAEQNLTTEAYQEFNSREFKQVCLGGYLYWLSIQPRSRGDVVWFAPKFEDEKPTKCPQSPGPQGVIV